MNTHYKTAPALLFAVVVLSLVACSQSNQSPEEQIKAYIAAAEVAVKERNLLTIQSMIAEGYYDTQGRNQKRIVSLTAGYFFRHKNIHLLTRIKKLTFPQPDQAKLTLLAGLAGDPVGDFEHLLSLRATIHLFNFHLIRQEERWLLQSSSWRRATGEDLLPSE